MQSVGRRVPAIAQVLGSFGRILAGTCAVWSLAEFASIDSLEVQAREADRNFDQIPAELDPLRPPRRYA